MAIINNYKFITPDIKLLNDEYWDFILSPPYNYQMQNLDSGDVISYFNFNKSYYNNKYNCFISDKNYIWENAINENITLNNYGITGVDNGSINYNKDTISNKEFINLFFNGKKDLTPFGNSFFLSPVDGNNDIYSYDYKLNDDGSGVSLNGGFFQGFFKVDGYRYQVLPDNIDDTLFVNISLQKKEYINNNYTLNIKHPKNKGMFFYMGIRGENKFYKYYNNEIDNDFDVDKCLNYLLDENDGDDCQYIYKNCNYLKTDVHVSDVPMQTNNDKPFDEYTKDIFSNNKFLTFHHSNGGFTTNNYEDEQVLVCKINKLENDINNKFLTFHHGKDGYTSENYEIDEKKHYNIIKDIVNNAIGFIINDDGSISYRYIVSNCDDNKKYTIIEEKSKSIIKNNVWYNIGIKFTKINNEKMKIFIYVNGYLIFISKELPIINLRSIDDTFDKQEGVSYNMSVGGGTQGLCDVIYPDYRDNIEDVLPLEEYFAGTFIGDIKSFKIFKGDISISQIREN